MRRPCTARDARPGWRNCAAGVVLGSLLLLGAPLAAQSPDDGFAPRVGRVDALTLRADGRILIGGEFTVVDGFARDGIARLDADGSVDATFNPVIDDFVYALAVQPDGRILIGGEFRSRRSQCRPTEG